MTGLSPSFNTNASNNAHKKEKKRHAKEQRGGGSSGRSKAGSSPQPLPSPMAPTPSQTIDSTTSESSPSCAGQRRAEEDLFTSSTDKVV